MAVSTCDSKKTFSRRSILAGALGGLGWSSLARADEVAQQVRKDAPIARKEPLKITKLETFLVKPRWLFLKVHTNAGIVGLGEPILEGRALTCAEAVKEIESYLIGKDPRQVVHHWQAIYRHAFYRGGPILTSALSGIDMALWDIKGKALGVPIYELLGGPTRTRIRVYAHAGTPERIKELAAKGFTAFKTGPAKHRPSRYVETPAEVHYAAEKFAELRQAAGDDVDIAIDFHGAISPALAKVLIKALEPYHPMFIEEPVQCQNHDIMAEIARGTHLPIATGERVFTRHHRSPSHCRHGRGLLRHHCPAQPARANLLGGGRSDGCLHSELPLPGAGQSWRRLHHEAIRRQKGIHRRADRARPGDRARRKCAGRQDRPRLEEPRAL